MTAFFRRKLSSSALIIQHWFWIRDRIQPRQDLGFSSSVPNYLFSNMKQPTPELFGSMH
uniref:Uncharacterized protein n=1 Tax=Solanum tuberosum TaxID=4113 RepID=M1C6J7_SOLTU